MGTWKIWLGIAVILLLCWVWMSKGFKGFFILSGALTLVFFLINYGGK